MVTRAPANRRSQRTRAELVRAAHRSLAETGAIQPEAVAAAAGVSTATFYAHFDGHDDAVAAALDVALATVVAVVEEEFRIETLIDDGLEAVVARLVTRSHRVFRDESLVLRAAFGRYAHHRPTADVYLSHERRGHDHLTRQIELGQKAGLLGPGPPDRRATSLLVALQGLHNPLLTKRRLDPVVADDLARAILAMLSP